MHTCRLLLAATAALITAPGAAFCKQWRVVEVYELRLKNLPSSERETYGPFLARRIEFYKQLIAPEKATAEAICESLLNISIPCHSPTALFFGGGTASGKGALTWSETMDMACNVTLIDPDAIMMQLDGWQDMVNARNRCAADVLHKSASVIANSCFADAVATKRNVVYDGTMSNFDSSTARYHNTANNGYRTVFFGVRVDIALAAARAWERAADGSDNKPPNDRYVALCKIVETHVNFAQNFAAYANYMPENQLFDTNGDKTLIYQNGTIINAALFQQFQAEANETEEEVKGRMSTSLIQKYNALSKECGSCDFSSSSTTSLPTTVTIPPSATTSPPSATTSPPSVGTSPSSTAPPHSNPSTRGSLSASGNVAIVVTFIILVML